MNVTRCWVAPTYCHAKGIISPAISWHVQLPLPANWNGRFLKWGDGGKDGDLDDPLSCGFDPDTDLAPRMCPAGSDGEHCLTAAELQTVKDFYSGPYDSGGGSIIKGRAPGSERAWTQFIPHAGNANLPSTLRGAASGHIESLFYEHDPGVPVADPTDLSRAPDRDAVPPEYAWWEFDIDDVTAGRADFMKAITNAGDLEAARDRARLFLFPGVGHCRGGAGPDRWDPLAPLVEWVENGESPDHVVAHRETDGRVDNERRVCAYPERAFYTGPDGGQNDPQNWVQANFSCR